VNLPFLRAGGTPEHYRAGIRRAIEKGWVELHESGTYVRFTMATGSASSETATACACSRRSQVGVYAPYYFTHEPVQLWDRRVRLN
jgi:hypothetical protein